MPPLDGEGELVATRGSGVLLPLRLGLGPLRLGARLCRSGDPPRLWRRLSGLPWREFDRPLPLPRLIDLLDELPRLSSSTPPREKDRPGLSRLWFPCKRTSLRAVRSSPSSWRHAITASCNEAREKRPATPPLPAFEKTPPFPLSEDSFPEGGLPSSSSLPTFIGRVCAALAALAAVSSTGASKRFTLGAPLHRTASFDAHAVCSTKCTTA